MSRPTCRTLSITVRISCKGLSPSMANISRLFHYPIDYHIQAHPISLATTLGISVDFFSCSYLDVSVRCVRLDDLWIQPSIPPQREGGFPHSDICGSSLACQLPAAFRRLPRPSSPVIAKASTTCTYSLDPITLHASIQPSAHRCQPALATAHALLLAHRLQNQAKHCHLRYYNAYSAFAVLTI